MDPSVHSSALSDSLQRLQLSQGADVTAADVHQTPNSARTAHLPEGYGFRPTSGISTPFTGISVPDRDSPIPDPNGLGWPGMNVIRDLSFRSRSSSI